MPDPRGSAEFAERAGGRDRPMWCDDFDMDLPKVIPDARDILGSLADVKLVTNGHTTQGVLNHPCVWNHDDGMVAFFGFGKPDRPEVYWTNEPFVHCTAWEAFRDAWAHHLIMLVAREPVWNTGKLWRLFERIMWVRRGWGECGPADADEAIAHARKSLQAAVKRFERVCAQHGVRPDAA